MSLNGTRYSRRYCIASAVMACSASSFSCIDDGRQFSESWRAASVESISAEQIFQAVIFESIEREIHHGLLPVDEAGDDGGAIAIVDVHDGHVGCATVQHAQQARPRR